MGYGLDFGNKVHGVVWGVVTHNNHPTGAYAVRVKFPWLKDAKEDKEDFLTPWCRVSTPMAGHGRGFYALPEVGDEVIVAFVHGSIQQPVVLGCVWSNVDKSPHGAEAPIDTKDPLGNDISIKAAATDTAGKENKNDARYITGRGGSYVLIDDTKDKEKITIMTKKGTCINLNDEKDVIAIYDYTQEVYLTMDAKKKKITLETKTGDIHIYAKKGLFNVEAKNITTTTEQDQKHKAKGIWLQDSKGTMDMKAGGTMTAKAPKIDLNP